MKPLRRFLILFILLIIYIYVTNITFLPQKLVLLEGENINLFTLWGISLSNQESTQAANNLGTPVNSENKSLGVEFLGIPLSNKIEVNIVENKKVIPLGNSIGLKLYTSGVLVVGMTEIEGKKPYENTGIEMGDRIVEVNNKVITNTQELIETVNQAQGKEIMVEYIKADDQTQKQTAIMPIKTSENEYKLGLWVRDTTAGIGTATFYLPETGQFACLGHGIVDIDTGKLVTIAKGELVSTKIISIQKGQKGEPGELGGSIEGANHIGKIDNNTNFGIFGRIENSQYLNINQEAIDILPRTQVKEGEAQIICEIETGKKEYYQIEIKKIYPNNYQNNKSMLIEVKDERLIEKTGGIVCGMSGSPIIQNGKLVGAVTNVLVSDPTVGYGVFADMMLQNM